ncbi:hypothetical protein BD779DRAFT_1557597 [Infundibulicybe gibba]|nr:hypothetical protein BD779DRAFT_1557597 [Infundibulicybe gibba]
MLLIIIVVSCVPSSPSLLPHSACQLTAHALFKSMLFLVPPIYPICIWNRVRFPPLARCLVSIPISRSREVMNRTSERGDHSSICLI